jgi:hypothetical protein
MRKLLLTLSAVLFTAGYSIPQGPCGPCGTCGEVKDVCCEKPAPGPFAFSYPKDIGLACPSNFYFFGEFLYMQAKEDGLEYAITDSPCNPITPATNPNILRFPVTNGETQGFCNGSENWHWNPGFRIGAGFSMDQDAWCLVGVWTNLNITDSANTNPAGTGRLIPLWMIGDPVLRLGQPRASARWKADYNTLDLHLGKPHHVSRHLVLTPHMGLRFVSIDQHYNVQYSANWNNSNVGEESPASFDGSNDFCGIGSRIGVDSDWILGCNAGFYANVAASIIYGKFCVDETWRGGPDADLNNQITFDPEGQMNSDLDFDVCTNISNFEIQMGVFWGMFFCDMKYHVGMRLGWEFHYWYDQNRFRKWSDNLNPIYNDTLSRGDLTLSGLSFRLQFDF